MTVGDNVPGTDADGPGFQMVGIPDGLGTYKSGRDTFTVLMNHELRAEPAQGITRDHGAVGAFVSKWTIDEDTLEVVAGEDLIKQVVLAPEGVYGAPQKGVVLENAQKTGAAIDSESRALGVTDFNRPEDGAWDPSRRDKFYWVTTGRPKVSGGNSRLWRFDFTNARKPEQGGTIDMLLDGSEGQEMMDNMTVDGYGRVLINEDPGNNPIASRIWSYEIRSDRLVEVAVQKQAHGPEPNPAYTGYYTNDEEVSGIIPADDILGKGWYLLDSQIHNSAFSTTSDAQKLVEKGQLLALYHPVGRDKDEDD
ncbi:MAG: hypothetical protein ACRDO9_06525 [Gaiellales bacterium]